MCAACAAADWPANETEWAAYLDPVVEEQLTRVEAPGAVVSVVRDGARVFSKGYGTAVPGREEPVDPAVTLFRVASISKVFTAVAVMQLAEAGKLELHADVNEYLKDFQLPETCPEPVTLYNLMTHTAGFDDRFIGMGARTFEDLEPLGVYLAHGLPPRVMPPGMCMSYSNHGFALAGHIVEAVSGMPFEEYTQQYIFGPLGMTHSTFELVPGPDTPLAQAYTYYLGKNHDTIYDYPCTPPASSMATTADDMALFMIAMLQEGRLGDARILGEEAAREMMQRQFGNHPKLPGRCYALSTRQDHGWRILTHTGQVWGFTSLLLLVPEAQAGLFVSCSTDRSGLYGAVWGRFMSALPKRPQPPDEPEAETPPPGAAERIAKAAGAFRDTRYCRSDFMKIATIIPQFIREVHVAPGARAGEITLRWAGRKGESRYAETEPWFFQGVYDKDGVRMIANGRRLAFRYDESADQVTHLFMGTASYERLARWERLGVLLGAAGVAAGIVLLYILSWPLRNWRRNRRDCPPAPVALRAERLLSWACIFEFLFPCAFGLFLLSLVPNDVGYGPPPALYPVLALPLIAAVLAALSVPYAARAWRHGLWHWSAKAAYTAALCATALFLALLNYWKLFGYRFG